MSDRNLDEYKKEERRKREALGATPEWKELIRLKDAREAPLEKSRKIVQAAATMMATPEYAAWELAKQALDFQKVCGCHHCADGIQALKNEIETLKSEVKQLQEGVQGSLDCIIKGVSYDPSTRTLVLSRSVGEELTLMLPNAKATVAGLMSSADKIKVDGIEMGATAGLTTKEIQDIVGAMFVGKTNISTTYDAAAGKIHISTDIGR